MEERVSELVASVCQLHQVTDKAIDLDTARPLAKFVVSKLRTNTDTAFNEKSFVRLFKSYQNTSELITKDGLTSIASSLAQNLEGEHTKTSPMGSPGRHYSPEKE